MKVCQLILMVVLYIFTTNVVDASKFRCGLCPAGFYLRGCKNSTTPKCTRCSSCHGRNNIVIRKCNGTHDTECQCKEGYWYDSGALYCAKCSSCRKGKGVEKNCTSTADTKCRRCVRTVTFSPVNSDTEACRPCKQCGANEDVVKQCSRRKDAECKSRPVKKEFQLKNLSKWPDGKKKSTPNPNTVEQATVLSTTTVRTVIEPTTPPSTVSVVGAIKQDDSASSETLQPVVILAVVGSILFLGLVVFIVIFVVKKRRKTTHPEKTRPQVVAVPPPTSQPKTSDSGLNTPLILTTTDKLLRDVSYSLLDELSRNLNPKGRWRTLAGKLGFSSKDIENFELDPTNATATMLSHWAHRKDSTVRNLYEAVKSLKWSVETDLVAKYLC